MVLTILISCQSRVAAVKLCLQNAAMAKKPTKRPDRRTKSPDKKKDAAIIFKVEAARKERYEHAADAADMPLSLWIRNLCDAACKAQGIE